MNHNPSSKFSQMQNWLNILLNTYAENPSTGLAKVIGFYVDKICHYEEVMIDSKLSCQYFHMRKFWQWRGGSK